MVLKIGTGTSPYFRSVDRLKQNLDYAGRVKQEERETEEKSFYNFVQMADENPSVYMHVKPEIDAYIAENPDKAAYGSLLEQRFSEYQERQRAQGDFYGLYDQGGPGAVPQVQEFDPTQQPVITPWGEGPIVYGEGPAPTTDQSFRPEDAPPQVRGDNPLSAVSTGELMKTWQQLPPGPGRGQIEQEIKNRTAEPEEDKFTGDYANMVLAGDRGLLTPGQVQQGITRKAVGGMTPAQIESDKDRDRSAALAQKKFEYQQERDKLRDAGGGEDQLTYYQHFTDIKSREGALLKDLVENYPEFPVAPFSVDLRKRLATMSQGKIPGNAEDAVRFNMYGNEMVVRAFVPMLAAKRQENVLVVRHGLDQEARRLIGVYPWMTIREARGAIVADALPSLEGDI